MDASIRKLAARRGALSARIESIPAERFVDHIHFEREGYRLTALEVVRSLCASGVLAAECRWDRLRPTQTMVHALGIDDGEFLAHARVGVALNEFETGDLERARRYLELAVLAAPSADMVRAELEAQHHPRALEMLASIKAASQAARRAVASRH